MPFNEKDKKIMESMKKSYGSKDKAERVFYASANAGKLGKDVKKRHGSKKKEE